MKTRTFPDKNYKSIFHNGKTLRIAIDPTKPIEELDYPEFYDVKITDKCNGKCPYCYQDSRPDQFHFADVLVNIRKFFGRMSENEKPFQVAIGGGNPNEHPDFEEILKEFYDMGIMPNYTTNGMGLTGKVLKATKKYCGGVAVSCHPHLLKYWTKAVRDLYDRGIRVNLHIIISDKESVDTFIDIYNVFCNMVDYFVLLPYTAAGRAKDKGIDYEYLMERMKEIGSIDQIAFGANFYPYLMDDAKGISLSLYEPEIMSKYLDMKDMKMYKSSFNLTEVKTQP